MKFLDGPAAETAIKKLLSEAERARVAVAYWGDGAVERLGINGLRDKDVQIVCDLRSGGCNPHEVKRLCDRIGSDRVKTCDRLHAKVWLSDKAAVIGSSNASANGLGYEGDETKALIEGDILTNDRLVLDDIGRWFEKCVAPCSRKITEEDLKSAYASWRRRRRDRDIDPRASTICEALRTNLSFFRDRDFEVWVWDWDNFSSDAERRLEGERRERYNRFLHGIEYYNDEEITSNAGSHILQFRINWNRTAVSVNLYRVMNDHPVVRLTRGRRLLLLEPVYNFFGLTLGDRLTLRQAATAAVRRSGEDEWYGNGEEFSRFLSQK